MQADFDKELQSYFTDVENLIEMFKQWLAAPALPKCLLVIHGVGGVGKSSLLRMFRLHCRSVHIPVALASGDEQKSALDVLTRWTEDLTTDGVALPAFKKTLAQYRDLYLKIEDEVAKMARKVTKEAAKTVVETVASTILGFSPLAGKLGGMSVEMLTDWLFSHGFKKPDVDLLLNPEKKLTENFLADVTKVASRRRLVLMLDTFEQITALEDWTREVAQRLHPNTLLVIAGRVVPDWDRAWPGWMANAQVEELKPMTETDMRELVRRYYAMMRGGEPDPKQVEAIIAFARGLPMVVTSAVRLWVIYGLEDFRAVKSKVVENLVDRLMEGVPKGLAPALEAAAIVRWFDQPILRAIVGENNIRIGYEAILAQEEAQKQLQEERKPIGTYDPDFALWRIYEELRRFPFVRPRAEGLALHDAVRDIMEESLRVRDAERHRELHERAAVYFEARLEKVTGEEAGRLELERLYHRIRADEEMGIQLFQEMAEELSRSRVVNRLRALLNDINTYPLERENSRLWREYYSARLLQLEGRLEDAREQLSKFIAKAKEPKMRAYMMIDYAEVLRLAKENELAAHLLEDATSFIPIDPKVIWGFHLLAGAYRRTNRIADSWRTLEKMRDLCAQASDHYGLSIVLDRLEAFYLGDENDLRRANAVRKQRLEILSALRCAPYMEMFVRGGLGFFRALLSGCYYEVELDLKRALEIARNLDATNIVYIARDLGFIAGMQEKYVEAQTCLQQSASISDRYGSFLSRVEGAVSTGFEGWIWMRRGLIREALPKLLEALEIKKEVQDTPGIPELYLWLGETFEAGISLGQLPCDQFVLSMAYYNNCISLARSMQSRRYFECGALTGLVRVKHAQGDYAAIPPLLAEAEQLAQRYEYNDHLASLRLTQGHIAWEGKAPSWENGFDAALRYYQQALIYALRYNRFLLNEVLSGRPQGTPLRPVIPECLKRGEEGRKMLVALRDWWQAGVNDIGVPRPDTISTIPEGISLLEAERIAREREPGDGLPQRSVMEQIERALAQGDNRG